MPEKENGKQSAEDDSLEKFLGELMDGVEESRPPLRLTMEEAERRMAEAEERPLSEERIKEMVRNVTGRPFTDTRLSFRDKLLTALDVAFVPSSIVRHTDHTPMAYGLELARLAGYAALSYYAFFK